MLSHQNKRTFFFHTNMSIVLSKTTEYVCSLKAITQSNGHSCFNSDQVTDFHLIPNLSEKKSRNDTKQKLKKVPSAICIS